MIVNGSPPPHRQTVVVHTAAHRHALNVQQGLGMTVSQNADRRLFLPARTGMDVGANLAAIHATRMHIPAQDGRTLGHQSHSGPIWGSGAPAPMDCQSVDRHPMQHNRTSAQWPQNPTLGQAGALTHAVSLGLSFGPAFVQHAVFEVKALQPQGAAEQSCQIMLGDRLLKVNGVNVVGRSASDVHNLMEGSAARSVSLVLQRRDGGTYFTNLQREIAQVDTHHEQSNDDDMLREVLGEGFEDSIWNEALSADRSVAGSGAVLHSTGTTQIHSAGSTGSTEDFNEIATSSIVLPSCSLEIDLQTDWPLDGPEPPDECRDKSKGHQSPPHTVLSEESISFQAALAKAVSLTSTPQKSSGRTTGTPSRFPKVKTRDIPLNSIRDSGWQSPRNRNHWRPTRDNVEMQENKTSSSHNTNRSKLPRKQVPEVIYAQPRKPGTICTPRTPRVLKARKVTREELTEAALGVIPVNIAGGAERPVSKAGSEAPWITEEALDLWVECVDEPGATEDVCVQIPIEKEKAMAEANVRKIVVRSSVDEGVRLGSVVGPGGMVPLLRAGAMLEKPPRTSSFGRSTELHGRGGRAGWMHLWVYTCVALLAGSVMLKINHGLGMDGLPQARGWTVMLVPLWVLWIVGWTVEVKLLYAAVRQKSPARAVSMASDCGTIAALSYGNSGLCGTALILALRADGLFASHHDATLLQWLSVLPAMLWVWVLFGACAVQIVRRLTSTGIKQEPLGTWVAALLAPATTVSLVYFLKIEGSTNPPVWAWYGVAGPMWGWLGLVLVAAVVRLRKAVREVNNEALSASVQVGADAVVWIGVSAWAVWWMQTDVVETCWWPLPWVGVWVMRVVASCATIMFETVKVTDVQVHVEGEGELYLTWTGKGTKLCGFRIPVVYEVDLVDAMGPGQTMRVYEGRQPRCRLAARWLGTSEASLDVRVVMNVLLRGRSEALCTVDFGQEGSKVREPSTPKACQGGLSVVSPWPSPMMQEGRPHIDTPVTPTAGRDPWNQAQILAPARLPLDAGALEFPAQVDSRAGGRRTSVMSYLASKMGATTAIVGERPSPNRRLTLVDQKDVGAAQKLRVDVGYFQGVGGSDASTHELQ